MRRAPIHHPIHAAIEEIWEAGHTPRLQVDARREDVELPEHVKEKWGARLVLDLDAAWPLQFEASEAGIQVDLAFQGVVSRCVLPWRSIYVVLDRLTGRGFVIEEHLPPDEAAPGTPAPRPASAQPRALRDVSARPPEAPEAEAPAPEAPAAEAPAPEAPAPDAPPPEAEAPQASDEEARRRRARFKVIDGGR
jgi:stringent starvation protein B